MKRKRQSYDPLFSEKSTVIFLDLLGFADLIRQKTDFYNRPDNIRQFYTSPSRSPRTLAARDVRRVYQAFHAEVRSLVLEAQRKRRGNRPLTSIIFSDSLYVFFETPDEAVDFARLAMQRMIRKSLTVRIGVGWGTADRLNFNSETFPSSDLILSAPFLGTGVVNAYRAESCGVRGMRILVHDSVAFLLKKTQGHRLLPLPRYEATESTKHEINYLNATGERGSTRSLLAQIRALEHVSKPRTAGFTGGPHLFCWHARLQLVEPVEDDMDLRSGGVGQVLSHTADESRAVWCDVVAPREQRGGDREELGPRHRRGIPGGEAWLSGDADRKDPAGSPAKKEFLSVR
jgi:hypothetical protein